MGGGLSNRTQTNMWGSAIFHWAAVTTSLVPRVTRCCQFVATLEMLPAISRRKTRWSVWIWIPVWSASPKDVH